MQFEKNTNQFRTTKNINKEYKMQYNFTEIEQKWQKYWSENQTFKTEIDKTKSKFYVLDMFPYPSGAGLHVGHPLGYIASDIYSRYMRNKGFNVLHPMGYDAFGLPAEQYAIQTGQHPAKTTATNAARYREQLQKIGFSYDWNRELFTSDADYYKWTQWAFTQMFEHYYCNDTQQARPIAELIEAFEASGNQTIHAANSSNQVFSAADWKAMSNNEQQQILLDYRIAYLADSKVNWCPKLGTVLANDEVKDGLSLRGGYPVEQKTMRQWSLRVSAYAERLLSGLDKVDWTESLKDMQRNWIGKSKGAQVFFGVAGKELQIEVFTTRPDTIYGATFMVLAPESELVKELTTKEQKAEIEAYLELTAKRTERERMSDTKTVSGAFTGAYGVNPFTGTQIPIWISDYVLSGYGTGAIMAVPAHDSRDYGFAKKFNLQIIPVIEGSDVSKESQDAKEGKMMNSDLINGMEVKDAIEFMISEIEKRNIGTGKTNYRLRDAIFSRQRYWGEPFPVYFKDNLPYVLELDKLPLELPEIDKFLPTETGEPPLGRAENWHTAEGLPFELSTMPGFAGSSAYYHRFMDPHNSEALVSKEANDYWQDVDLYIGGTEHATGHLIYSRFWNKFLFDLGYVCKEEPFKKLINQGMIQGRSNFVYRVNKTNYAHAKLWEALNNEALGVKFKQNYNFDNHVYAFVCEEKNLFVEIESPKNLQNTYNELSISLSKKGNQLVVLSYYDVIDFLQHTIAYIKDVMQGDAEVCTDFSKKEQKTGYLFVSKDLLKPEYNAQELHVDVNIVKNDVLDLEAFKKSQFDYENAEFVLSNGKYHCGYAVEKMSKSMFNVVNPDVIIAEYGADTLRLYEMFLGPLEQSKPWDTNGIDGVHKFLRKLWRLFYSQENQWVVNNEEPTKDELKVINKTIKKISEDITRFSYNTSVSAFMICVNELNDLRCNKRAILEDLLVILSPFAPHIAEELWQAMGKTQSIAYAKFPDFDESILVENTKAYPISFNGKTRFTLDLPVGLSNAQIEHAALTDERASKWLEGKAPRKVIVVQNKIVNVVV